MPAVSEMPVSRSYPAEVWAKPGLGRGGLSEKPGKPSGVDEQNALAPHLHVRLVFGERI